METLWQDIRFGIRLWARKPGFTAVAVLTLALGIGANTAIFSAANALFLRPLKVADSDRVARLYAAATERSFDVFSYPNYADLRDRNETFADLAAHQYVPVSLNTGDRAEEARGELVTGNYFPMLGVSAALGRTLLPSDDESPGAHPVVALNHRLWQRNFGEDASVVGRKVYLNGHPFTVIGVMPEGFAGSYEAFTSDFWVPMMMHEQVRPRGLPLTRRGWGWLNGTGRLKPGVTLAQAQDEINRLALQLQQEQPQVNQGVSFQLLPAGALPEQFRAGMSKALLFFMVVVSLVLLVACANIASILLSRMVARRRETAIRQALGANRSRLACQWLTESLLLALLGGGVGLLVTVWVQELMMALSPPDFTNFAPALSLDGRALIFTLVVTLLAGLIFGLIPAVRTGRAGVHTALKEEGTSSIGSVRQSRFFGLFVITQVAVSLVLLVVAGLLLRSLRESTAFHPGFNTENVLLAMIDLKRNGYNEERGREFYRQLGERLKSVPGVIGATSALVTPLGDSRESQGFRIEGHRPPEGKTAFSIAFNVVGPDYFATMGIPILRGRGFDERDGEANARPVVVINETMARRFWPGEDAVGRYIQSPQSGGKVVPLEIVGVARDIKYYSLGEPPQPYVYASFAQRYSPEQTLHLRAAGDPKSLAGLVRKEVEALDPNITVSGLASFAEFRQIQLFPIRALATVSTLFGLLALALTAVGIYGVVSYSVSQRAREIGIRMALGAEKKDIFKLVIGQGLILTLIGVAAGLAASFALTHLLSSLLFGVGATDPITFAGVSLLLGAITMLACYLPARRATKVDPMVALRYE